MLGLIACVSSSLCIAQSLKVIRDPHTRLIDRGKSEGIATIVFDSKVKNLEISVNGPHELIRLSPKSFIYRVDPKKDIENWECCQRTFTLKSPKSNIHREELDISPNTMYYYTVILPEQYPQNFSAEYLLSKTAMHGVRVAYGKRYGVYLSYKWGEYKKSGADIAAVTEDYDVTRAKELGYVRTAITGGLRLGVLHSTKASLYLLLGGGYGEYGRQWQNPLEVDKSIYFHSDYFKGFEGNLACQSVLWDWLCLSAGADMLVGNGHFSVDYQLGIGVNLNMDKLFKRRIKD